MPESDQRSNSVLEQLAIERLSPLCLVIDSNERITHFVGSAETFGYPLPKIGVAITEHFDFLFGVSFADNLKLPFIETPSGAYLHVQIKTANEGREVIIVDASEEHAQQQALQQKSNELQLLGERQAQILEQLQDLNSQLAEKKREADALNQLQGRFIANMSHEFRTPLSSIVAYAEYLGLSDSKISLQEGLGTIDRAAKHLLNLVENLIGQAQFQLDEVVLVSKDVQIRNLCRELEALFEPMAAAKGLRLTVSPHESLPRSVIIDQTRVRQILINVVGNAVKYTTSGSVEMTVQWRAGRLVVVVNDTGPGISAKRQDAMFMPFSRGDAGRVNGAGLGLSITKGLVGLMDGTVKIDSTVGVGTTVTIDISAPESLKPKASDPVRQGRAVLVVEDDSDVYDILEIYLEQAGFSVYHADSGTAALDEVTNVALDAVITDLNVPDCNGIEIAKALQIKRFAGPIVILTASNLARDRRQAMAAGCTAFLVKPVNPNELVAAIETGQVNTRADGLA